MPLVGQDSGALIIVFFKLICKVIGLATTLKHLLFAPDSMRWEEKVGWMWVLYRIGESIKAVERFAEMRAQMDASAPTVDARTVVLAALAFALFAAWRFQKRTSTHQSAAPATAKKIQ